MGAVFVISGPSGAGKTTVCREVMERLPDVHMSVSHTTRPRRNGEQDGVHYHFVDAPTFEAMVKRGEFAEWAVVHNHRYGTSKAELERAFNDDELLLVEIDAQGARQLKENKVPATFIFIEPPDLAVLEDRLVRRQTDSPEAIRARLETAKGELTEAKWYDYTILNDRLEETVERLAGLVAAAQPGAPPASSSMGK